jgi:hypothetical protein
MYVRIQEVVLYRCKNFGIKHKQHLQTFNFYA